MLDLAEAHPRVIRAAIREGRWRKPTAGLAVGYAQANLVILPKEMSDEFELFCRRNPKPCPLLGISDPGIPRVPHLSADADLRTDLPFYRIYREGRMEASAVEITSHWRDDLVSFLLGCSFTFEAALLAAGIPVRHLEEGGNVPMYITNVACVPTACFQGPMVVSMRPIPGHLVDRAIRVTSRYPAVHGGPVHSGDPGAIGVDDLCQPDFGDPVTLQEGEVPVFWACGVTPQVVAREARPALMITHEPGHMFITDLRNEDLADLWRDPMHH